MLGLLAATVRAQHQHGKPSGDSAKVIGAADEAMSGMVSANARKHLELSPARKATREDSAKAWDVVKELRAALAKYKDTSAAVAAGYKMFMPNVKQQHTYHFTNYRHALMEAFRFDAAKPTSILYERDANGSLKLVGAMYTAPRRVRLGRLDDRVPLSIARWHKHVNWCTPPKGQFSRWGEWKGGTPVFGPESPIATKRECDEVDGEFHSNLFGWMIHASVFSSNDLGSIFSHEH